MEVKIRSHSWTNTLLRISFTGEHLFHIFVQIDVVNEHHKEKKIFCSSNEFFIPFNLTLLLVCGLEANKHLNCIV